METIYKNIQKAISSNEKLLAVLIDPDKFSIKNTRLFIQKINDSIITHIFVGGSIVENDCTSVLVGEIRKYTSLPVVLFPGDITQISKNANALLFLSLISGRNPDYLIGKQVQAVSKLRKTNLEIIPTGYVLIENGKQTTIEKVTKTKPLLKRNIQNIIDTAKAGELLGMKIIYLEAGSGALHPIPTGIISKVKNELNIPLIVGGGIKKREQLLNAYDAGADLIVIGTAFENDDSFFEELKDRSLLSIFPNNEELMGI